MTKPLIILAAGGTGGHLFPAISLAHTLNQRGNPTVILTDQRGKAYVQDLPYIDLPLTRLHRSGFRAIQSAFQLLFSLFKALYILITRKPAAIIGFGGYATAPSLLAALLVRTPIILFEADARLGLVNRWFKRWARAIAVGTPHPTLTIAHHTGLPLRPAFTQSPFPAYSPPAADQIIRILIVGGSQGARSLSTVVPQAISQLPTHLRSRLEVTQQARSEFLDSTRSSYDQAGIRACVEPFLTDIPQRLSEAHLVIARAGASTLAEIACAGRPAILVPYIHGPDDHQTQNAQLLANNQAAWHYPETQLTPEHFSQFLTQILQDPQALTQKAEIIHKYYIPNASEKLAELLSDIIYK